MNNLATHRIEVDPVRGPLIANLFELYAGGEYSVGALVAKARAMGLTHLRSNRPMMKAEIHRILQNPIYVGDFRWHGKLHHGSHEPLVTRDLFAKVQTILGRKPRARYPKQRHAFMGLLTCGRCGCTITAERKKGRYTYYRCTAFRGRCGNTYIREEELAELLGKVVQAIQIPEEWAEWIANAVRDSEGDLEAARVQSIAQLNARRRLVRGKLDRGYDDYTEGRISGEFWSRKSAEWETELAAVEAELSRLSQPTPAYTVTAARILELAKTAYFLYSKQDLEGRRQLLDSLLSNCTFDRGTLCPTYVKPFDLLSRGRENGEWRGGRDSSCLADTSGVGGLSEHVHARHEWSEAE